MRLSWGFEPIKSSPMPTGNKLMKGEKQMAKLQKFHDIRYGNTATLRIEKNKVYGKPYVLRVRNSWGHLYFICHYATADEAKRVLETMEDPLCFQMCSFYTDDDSGYVE